MTATKYAPSPCSGEVGLTCGPEQMSQINAGNSETAYGKAILIDFRTRAVYRPANRRECIEAKQAMKPLGPGYLTLAW